MNITQHDTHIILTTLTLEGRLDAFTVPALRSQQEALLEQGRTHFVIDLSAVAFMDSAGMSALVSLLKRARQAGGEVVLVKPQDPAAYRILTLTRFDQVFTLKDTAQDALKALMTKA